MLSSRRKTPAFTGAAVFTIVAVLGAYDLPKRHAALLPESPLPAESVAAFSRKLSGGKFGYFATSDRNWWIPVHSSLAAISGSTCIRLNPLPVDQDWAGKQYGSDVPEQIVPRSDHESGEDWSGRLAEALGINHLLAGPDSVLPGPLREQFVPVADAGVYSLWERKTSGVQIK